MRHVRTEAKDRLPGDRTDRPCNRGPAAFVLRTSYFVLLLAAVVCVSSPVCAQIGLYVVDPNASTPVYSTIQSAIDQAATDLYNEVVTKAVVYVKYDSVGYTENLTVPIPDLWVDDSQVDEFPLTIRSAEIPMEPDGSTDNAIVINGSVQFRVCDFEAALTVVPPNPPGSVPTSRPATSSPSTTGVEFDGFVVAGGLISVFDCSPTINGCVVTGSPGAGIEVMHNDSGLRPAPLITNNYIGPYESTGTSGGVAGIVSAGSGTQGSSPIIYNNTIMENNTSGALPNVGMYFMGNGFPRAFNNIVVWHDDVGIKAAPSSIGITPRFGPVIGHQPGTPYRITVIGPNMANDTRVWFGTNEALFDAALGQYELPPASPAQTGDGPVSWPNGYPQPGVYDVTIMFPSGLMITLPDAFTYLPTGFAGLPPAQTPVVDAILPDVGPLLGGQHVVILGQNFEPEIAAAAGPFGPLTVTIGGTPLVGVEWVSENEIHAVTVLGASGPVQVINPNGLSDPRGSPPRPCYCAVPGFPKVDSVEPNKVTMDGDPQPPGGIRATGSFTIKGANFATTPNVPMVTVGGVPARQVTSISSSEIWFDPPPAPNGGAGVYDLVVTNPDPVDGCTACSASPTPLPQLASDRLPEALTYFNDGVPRIEEVGYEYVDNGLRLLRNWVSHDPLDGDSQPLTILGGGFDHRPAAAPLVVELEGQAGAIVTPTIAEATPDRILTDPLTLLPLPDFPGGSRPPVTVINPNPDPLGDADQFASMISQDLWVLVPPGADPFAITDVTNETGPELGGTNVIISGTGFFLAGVSAISQVFVGPVLVPFTVGSDNTLSFTTPPSPTGQPGTQDIKIIKEQGAEVYTITILDGFEYLPNATGTGTPRLPRIGYLSPDTHVDPTAPEVPFGGDVYIRIFGSDFEAYQMPDPAGELHWTADVIFEDPANPGVALETLPRTGPNSPQDVIYVSEEELVLTYLPDPTPPVMTVNVYVNNLTSFGAFPAGASNPVPFTYLPSGGGPVITSIFPPPPPVPVLLSGETPDSVLPPDGVPDPIVITGANFTSGTVVYVGHEAAELYTPIVGTQAQIAFWPPPAPDGKAGVYDIVVVDPSGNYAVADDAIVYYDDGAPSTPFAIDVEPNCSPVEGGEEIRLRGRGFTFPESEFPGDVGLQVIFFEMENEPLPPPGSDDPADPADRRGEIVVDGVEILSPNEIAVIAPPIPELPPCGTSNCGTRDFHGQGDLPINEPVRRVWVVLRYDPGPPGSVIESEPVDFYYYDPDLTSPPRVFSPTLGYNDVFGNKWPYGTTELWANYDGVAPGPGSISAHPLFLRYPSDPIHLDEMSPCEDVAADDEFTPEFDIDRQGRPDPDGDVDIGADEIYIGSIPIRVCLVRVEQGDRVYDLGLVTEAFLREAGPGEVLFMVTIDPPVGVPSELTFRVPGDPSRVYMAYPFNSGREAVEFILADRILGDDNEPDPAFWTWNGTAEVEVPVATYGNVLDPLCSLVVNIDTANPYITNGPVWPAPPTPRLGANPLVGGPWQYVNPYGVALPGVSPGHNDILPSGLAGATVLKPLGWQLANLVLNIILGVPDVPSLLGFEGFPRAFFYNTGYDFSGSWTGLPVKLEIGLAGGALDPLLDGYASGFDAFNDPDVIGVLVDGAFVNANVVGFSVDGRATSSLVSGWGFPFAPSDEGVTILQPVTRDRAGNVSDPDASAIALVWDPEPPVPEFVARPANPSTTPIASFAFRAGSGGDPSLGNVGFVAQQPFTTFLYQLERLQPNPQPDLVPWTASGSPVTFKPPIIEVGARYQFFLAAVDYAGNLGEMVVYDWSVVSPAPDTVILTHPDRVEYPDPAPVFTSSATFTFKEKPDEAGVMFRWTLTSDPVRDDGTWDDGEKSGIVRAGLPKLVPFKDLEDRTVPPPGRTEPGDELNPITYTFTVAAFVDETGNGVYDKFVDLNDNNKWDPGEGDRIDPTPAEYSWTVMPRTPEGTCFEDPLGENPGNEKLLGAPQGYVDPATRQPVKYYREQTD